MTGCGNPNAHGVYEPQEVLTLERDTKGWRGLPAAEIELVNLGSHWLYAVNFQLMSGDHWGRGEPLVDRPIEGPNSRRAPSRDAAIEAASEKLREAMTKRAAEYRDARRILDWLVDLRPAQPDLFAALAA